MATVNGKQVNVNINGMNGFSLTNLNHHNPAEVKKAIYDAQKAIKQLMGVCVGEDNIFLESIYDSASRTNDVIKMFVADVPTEVRTVNSVEQIDFSDVPFIRSYDNDWHLQGFDYEPVE